MTAESILVAVALGTATVVLLVLLWLVHAMRGLRRSSDRQVALLERQIRLLETQGQVQGWLPPAGTEPWRPSHLRR